MRLPRRPQPKPSSSLLADNDSTNNFPNELLLKYLRLAPPLLAAENGVEALAVLATRPALILLDVNRPVINGTKFLEAYWQLQPASHTVMLPTTLDSRDLARIQELPIIGLVSKPLTVAKVNTILQPYF